jgi:hypothetical protein
MTLVADSCASPSKDYIFPNVRDHRWLPVARLMAGSDSDQASGVTRVAIRCIALFGILFSRDNVVRHDCYGLNISS